MLATLDTIGTVTTPKTVITQTATKGIVATATLYMSSMNDDSNLDEGDLLLDLNRQIKQYQTWRKDH